MAPVAWLHSPCSNRSRPSTIHWHLSRFCLQSVARRTSMLSLASTRTVMLPSPWSTMSRSPLRSPPPQTAARISMPTNVVRNDSFRSILDARRTLSGLETSAYKS